MAVTPPSWKLSEAKLSVSVNGVYVRFEALPKSMHRFVRPAMFRTDDEGYELRYFGTSCLFRYREKTFAVTTAHQTGNGIEAPEAEAFVVVVDDDTKRLSVSPSSIHRVKKEGDHEPSLSDLLFYEYDVPSAVSSPEFLNLSDVQWSDSSGLKNDYSFLIGFPSQSVVCEPDPTDGTKLSEFVLRWVQVDLQPTQRERMDTENREMFTKHPESTKQSVNPDGLSGSPVFSIVHDVGKNRQLQFNGILTNAKSDRFAVYPSSVIRHLLDGICDAS